MRWYWIVTIILVAMELVAFLKLRTRKWNLEYSESDLGCNFIGEGNWHACCVQHDKDYRRGGYFLARLIADLKFFWCSLHKNIPVAIFMFVGERFTGMWAFHWGAKKEITYTKSKLDGRS